jgi:glyoxylase-like metal-dependent hydrolase (beta-lactamase superfamily II)
MSDKIVATLNQLAETTVARTQPNTCFGAFCPGAWGWSSPYFNTFIASPAPPKSIRYVINTSAAADHVAANEKIAASGRVVRAGGFGFGGAIAEPGRRASIVSHVNVLDRLSGEEGPSALPEAAWPNDTYLDEFYKLSEYVNGEAVIVYHAPSANTDGDSFVFFRHSEVISAGDLLSTISYPLIDVAQGGAHQGVFDGLNHILDLAVAEYRSQGGTWIIPGRGRLTDTADVASYRNMLVMVRDRVRDLMSKGMTLEQVKAARPTMDFDGRYGTAAAGAWTTDKFVEAGYRSLQEKK